MKTEAMIQSVDKRGFRDRIAHFNGHSQAIRQQRMQRVNFSSALGKLISQGVLDFLRPAFVS